MRLIVARCEVAYIGRLTTALPEAVRLLMLKADGTFMVWADGGGPNVKPLNWMTPPTVLEEQTDADGRLSEPGGAQAAPGGSRGDHDRGGALGHRARARRSCATLEKEGLERELQELLADAPQWCGEGFRLVRREWPTDIGPVDLMCRDTEDEWIAVEIKRIATIDAVEQLTRYLRADSAGPRARLLPGRAGGADHQAAGARARAGAGDRLRRGRSAGAARRARAGSDAVRGVEVRRRLCG